MLRVNNKLWIISDTHFGHRNIVAYEQRPDDHETQMLANWTRLVQPHHQILHMGDVVFSSPQKWQVLINHLPGEKYLIKGNHDKKTNAFYEGMGFTIVPEFVHEGVMFTHRPASSLYPGPKGEWTTNIHGHGHTHGHGNPHHEEDGEYFSSKYYINLCVEKTDLAPVQLGNVLKP